MDVRVQGTNFQFEQFHFISSEVAHRGGKTQLTAIGFSTLHVCTKILSLSILREDRAENEIV